MIDFLKVSTRQSKRGYVEIYPNFVIKKSSDLMIRGGDFYAIWMEERGLWSTDEQDALYLIDRELDRFAEENRNRFDAGCKVLHMWDSETGMIDRWHKYCQKQSRDSFHILDEKLIFSNDETSKEDYASRRLDYPLVEGSIEAYDKLMSVLYSPDERKKIEWAIGSIVEGDSKKIQKFMVLYGAAGTGKSTVLNIIQKLFKGYYSVFDAKALGSSNNAFALEAFKTNPLVAIQHDGDLSRIEDNTRLNSLVSHEIMTVNEKFKSTYASQFKCFLFMGTNKPVRITDAKSGLIRRLIDVSPTGDKISYNEYRRLINQIEFELGAIAYHCWQVYLNNKDIYDEYIPIAMLGASNDFYNFVLDSYFTFLEDDGASLKVAWEMYNTYCTAAKVNYPMSQRAFKEELKNYFKEYKDRITLDDGTRLRSYYKGFKKDKFEETDIYTKPEPKPYQIEFNEKVSLFDKLCAECPAQEASPDEKPIKKWEDVDTKLSDIDTKKLHYVRVPLNHIVIDFDIPDENGNKCFKKNLEAASKWPKTYAELSKSGQGIHLHYIYAGKDPEKLCRVYDEHIEVKVFTGKSSLRRKLTKCNDIPIATISSGLPLKGDKKMVDIKRIENERHLRVLIKRALNREIHPNTKPSIDFIVKILDEAAQGDFNYDISDMKPAILAFAAGSSHQSEYCIKQMNKMKFKLDHEDSLDTTDTSKIIFYDIEIFPNLLLVNWKFEGPKATVVRMINPTKEQIEQLIRFKLIGFNNRRYDNHILYGRLIGESVEQLYNRSVHIINGDAGWMFSQAYNLSYTDVYDFSSKKQSLKKFEIELGIHHKELGLPWDKPVPEDMWEKVAEYCDNDVIATEAVFEARKADFTAREILAAVAGMSVNDTTNSLTTRIIFGNDKSPQGEFNYRNMGDTSAVMSTMYDDEYTCFDKKGRPIFPGYLYDKGKSTYRGEEVGEGGYVYSEPGMYTDVALLDIASMHPSSIVAEDLFGARYTQRFKDILEARIAIKHKDFDKARTMLGGALAGYLTDENTAKDLAQALKIAINSVYGLTSAKFDNPMRDIRNKDNIVAKRGALFMINLKHQVQKRGFTVAHIKTDSIKIPNATKDIIDFVMEYGRQYGYNFEHEATYEKMCLVNDAVYIAKYNDGPHEFKLPTGEKVMTPWTATGTQFQVPYVFKKLFSKNDILFSDMCETKSVTSALYLDFNENLGDNHNYVFVGKVGSFCPIKSGCGGGVLLRETATKTGEIGYSSATGAKGYRWLEAEMVKELGKEESIDRSYYDIMVDEAVKDISQYGDFEWFAQ